ncbi:MAG: hypothetical protein ACLP7Q_03615 [Isosphaeraceae bacterium]
MPPVQWKAEVPKAVPSLEGMQAEKVELKHPEDEQEKKLRLHKERWSFYVKELVTPAFAALIVIVAVTCCLWFLFNSQSAAAEKEWARSVLMAVLTGAVGYAFGRATK